MSSTGVIVVTIIIYMVLWVLCWIILDNLFDFQNDVISFLLGSLWPLLAIVGIIIGFMIIIKAGILIIRGILE